jgi:hypothetical protein
MMLTADRKYRYQNYQMMMTRKGCDAWADAMMDLMEMVGRLDADNVDLRRQVRDLEELLRREEARG